MFLVCVIMSQKLIPQWFYFNYKMTGFFKNDKIMFKEPHELLTAVIMNCHKAEDDAVFQNKT